MAKITINDIARMANVSPAAVSYVINDRPGVSPETREAIRRIIEQTGYTPNLTSRKLKLHRSFNIHVVIGSVHVSFDDLFYNSAIERMLDVCNAHGYSLVLSNTDCFERSALHRAIEQQDVDGVVFLQDVVAEALPTLQQQNIPYVVLDAHKLSAEHNCVYCDYGEAAHTATAYLLGRGHHRIGFVGTDRIPEFFQAACDGYRRALAEQDISPADAWVCRCADDRDVPDTVPQALTDDSTDLTAVVCATDLLAVTLMQRLAARGVAVPQQLSVCGMDDVLIARYCTPTLTTVEIDKQAMGEAAIHLLLEILDEKGEQTPRRICIHGTTVVERDSVAEHH